METISVRGIRFWTISIVIFIAFSSNTAFSHVTLNSPDGGEVLVVGTQTTIQWTVLIPHSTTSWELHYSTTGSGGPWIEIAVNIPVGDASGGAVHFYQWTIPDDESEQVRVRATMVNTVGFYQDISSSDNSITFVDFSPHISPIMAMDVEVGSTLNFDIDAADSNGTTPTFEALNLPANSGFSDNGDGTATFNISPEYFQIGLHDITFVASDGINSDSQLVVVTVTPCCDLAGDFDKNGSVDISDLTSTVNWMFKGGVSPTCVNMADVNESCGTDVADLTHRVNFMFKGGAPLVCGCSN